MGNKLEIVVNGKTYEVEVVEIGSESINFLVQGRLYQTEYKEQLTSSDISTNLNLRPAKDNQINVGVSKENSLIAPMPGLIKQVLIKEGVAVNKGDTLLRMEAMKMENNILSPRNGKIKKILVKEGEEVLDGQCLLKFEE